MGLLGGIRSPKLVCVLSTVLVIAYIGRLGAFVLEAFKHPETWIGKDFRVQSDVFTPREFVKCISDTSGTQIEYVETTREAFNGLRDVKDTITHELWAK